jgi:CRP-like cAMP-binding protein
MAEPIDLNAKMEFLRKQSVFSELTDEETESLAQLLTEKHFKPGETIVTEGDPVDSVFLIISGTADIRHITFKDQVPQIKSITQLGPNEAIGLNETGFYSLSGVRTATVTALSDMAVLKLSVAAFHGFTLTHPHVNEIMRKNAESFLGR